MSIAANINIKQNKDSINKDVTEAIQKVVAAAYDCKIVEGVPMNDFSSPTTQSVVV
ncbi:ERBB-3 BINDING PROTEIN 1 [Senna tora]|uniref:ERBB-3 BINDING PROTEIN 1 n=1 Tax=Senna tora TaxID=362788 RepID=A0A835C8I1_9FABA|nr:ERBB-3 BINDING PROTEIN 1 [Senna tora]